MSARRAGRARRPRRHGPEQSGFTLVELLVAIVVEALIIGALGGAFVVVLHSSSTVNDSLDRSSDARFAAHYIVSDARNSSGPETSLTDTTSCADPSPPVTGTPSAVVRFDWNSSTSAGSTKANIVDYVLVSNALLRRHCVGGALVSDDVIAGTIASVLVSCSPSADCSGTPTAITVTVTETADSSGSAPYTYSLTSTFRKLLGNGSPLIGTQSVIALGTGGACSGGAGVDLSGTSQVRVYGDTYVNSSDGSGCTAMSTGTSSTYQAGGTSILEGGSCSTTPPGTCPPSTPYSPAIADPYASLPAPSTSGQPSRSGCAGGTAQPGVYAATLTIASTCQLASGVYILQNGLNLASGAVLTNAAGGVLLYVTGGTISDTGSTTTLAAQTSGTYAGVVVWQAAADTNAVAFGGSAVLHLTGAIYAPKATFSLNGDVNATVTSLVVQTISVTGSSVLTIGSPSATPLSISGPASLADWTVNRAYASTTMTGSGGDSHYSWSATGLPAGLSINATTGVISGTPTATGAATVTVTLQDALGDDPASRTYSITINGVPSITTASLPNGATSIAYSKTLAGSGGTTPYTWTATGVPAGLTLAASTGVLSGTPTATGAFTVAVTLTDASGTTASRNLSLTIGSPTSITSVKLANGGGGTAGTIEANDTITIVFSASMSVSSFCSAWSNDASNQSLNSNNDVTVTVTDGSGGGHDTVSVTSASCTFGFGSIDLGSGAYVSSTATFRGTGGGKSKITWTASTHTLVITLGAMTGGTVANVASSTPIYTAAGAVVDSSGVGLANSPFTLAAGKQF